MQQKQNWILLNKHESLPEQTGSKRVIYHRPIIVSSTGQATFVHRPTREALQRISSINKLNDRIRKKLEENDVYASTSIFDRPRYEKLNDELASEASRIRANKVVDDHFDFIKRERSDFINNTPTTPQDIYVQERNSRGSIEAVFERRPFWKKRPLTDPFPEEFDRDERRPLGDKFPDPPSIIPRRSIKEKYPEVPSAILRRPPGDIFPENISRGQRRFPESFREPRRPPESFREQRRPPESFREIRQPYGDSYLEDSFRRRRKSLNDPFPEKPFRRHRKSLTDPFPEESSRAPERVHHVPIQIVRKRADSLDSGSVRLGVEKDPHPTPMTPSEWQTPIVSQRPSFSQKGKESFNYIRPEKRQFRNRQFQNSRRPSVSEFDRVPRRSSNRISRRTTRVLPRKTPSLLRRDSYFYKKCDICFNERRLDGIPCPACNSVSTRKPTRRYSKNFDYQPRISRIPSKGIRMPPPPVTIEPYFEGEEGFNDETSSTSTALPQPDFVAPGKSWGPTTVPPRTPSQVGFYEFSSSPRRQTNVLNADNLQRHPSYLAYMKGPLAPAYIPVNPHSPGSRQSTVIWPANAGPAWKSIDRRPRASPIFRYGKSVPKWLYDYDAYAEEQRQKEIERRKRKVIALTLVFLFFALVVAAGVVLAALN